MIYASGIKGKAGLSPDNLADDLGPLFETIIRCIPEPSIDKDGALQMLVSVHSVIHCLLGMFCLNFLRLYFLLLTCFYLKNLTPTVACHFFAFGIISLHPRSPERTIARYLSPSIMASNGSRFSKKLTNTICFLD